jgi:hypothetical protein
MKLKILKEIEIWQQSYKFDYNCFNSTNQNLHNLEKLLKEHNIHKTVLELSTYYNFGSLYNKNLDELKDWSLQCLNIDYNLLPPHLTQLSYFTSHGKNKEFLNKKPFNEEFLKYFKELSKKLLELGCLIPDISKINLEPLKYSMILLNDTSLLSANKTFEDYLLAINENEDWKKLNILTKMDKKTLSMPLFYRFILTAYAEYHDNYPKDNYTSLFFEETRNIFLKHIIQNYAA